MSKSTNSNKSFQEKEKKEKKNHQQETGMSYSTVRTLRDHMCGQIRILKHDKSLLKTSHTKARRTTNDPNNAYKHKILQTLI